VRFGLERRVVFLRVVVPLRFRDLLDALKARQPFLKPILAYFLGRPGLGIGVPCRVKMSLPNNYNGTLSCITWSAQVRLNGVKLRIT